MLKKQIVFMLLTLILLSFVACDMLTEDEPPAAIMFYENVTAGYDTVSFSIRWAEGFESTTLTSLSIWDGEVKVRNLDVNATEATGLLSNHSYRLVATYQNGGAEKTEGYVFTTLAKSMPSVTLEKKDVDYTILSFGLTLTDPSHVAEIKKIELWKDGVLAQSLSDLSKRSFEGLYSGTAYEIRVTFDYNLNEGASVQTTTQSLMVTTLAKSMPSVTLERKNVDYTTLSFGLMLTDPSHVAEIMKIELRYEGEVVQALSDLSVRSFEGLYSGTVYEILVSFEYDLNEGDGKQTATQSLMVTTLAKTVPSVRVEGRGGAFTTISFDVTLTDPSRIADIKAIELWKDGVLVQSLRDLSKRSFEDLYSGTEYEIRVTIEYNLNTSAGVLTQTETVMYHTKAKTSPIVSVNGVTSGPYELGFEIRLSDRDEIFTLVDVKMTHDGTDIPMENTLGAHHITGLIPNETYILSVLYTCDAGDGKGAVLRTFMYEMKTHNVVTINGITYELSRKGDGQKLAKVISADASLTEILEFVCLDYTVTAFFNGAFSACVNLTNVVIPDSVQIIGRGAFYNCSLLNQIFLPSSVTTIGENAIRTLTIVYAEAASKPSGWDEAWHSEGKTVFWNVKALYTDAQDVTYILFNDNTAVLQFYTGSASALTVGVSGYTVTEILPEVFKDDPSLISVTILAGVRKIGDGAFQNCSNLKNVILPSTLETIGDEAFNGTSSLLDIAIPFSVQTIGESAIFSQTTVYVGVASKPSGWASNWHNQATIRDFWNFKEFYTDAQGVTYALFYDNTALVKSYTGTVATLALIVNGYTVSEILPNAFRENEALTSITIPEGVHTIGSYAFISCRSLVTLSLPSTLRTIEAHAFSDCRALRTLEIPEGVETLGESAFSNCLLLASVRLPNTIRALPAQVFSSCYSLTNVSLPSTLESIGNSCFNGAHLLRNLVVPASVHTIGSWAIPYYTLVYAGAEAQPSGWDSKWHEDCAENVTWNVKDLYTSEQGVTYALFNDNTALVIGYEGTATSVTLAVDGYSIVSIEAEVFAFIHSLTKITIPNTVTKIGDMAFYNCSALTNIRFNGIMAEWNDIEKGDLWNENIAAGLVVQCNNGSISSGDDEDVWQGFIPF